MAEYEIALTNKKTSEGMMADIFLSYSRADRPTAHVIAEALEAEGFSVWWDKVLRAGQTYDEVTENMLRDSSVVGCALVANFGEVEMGARRSDPRATQLRTRARDDRGCGSTNHV